MDPTQLIDHYQLQPHPEGGWFREVHRSHHAVARADGQQRSALTAIIFLLQSPDVSRWHRVSCADETWHFVAGDPLELLLLPPGGGEITVGRLSANLETAQDQPLLVVPAGWWQAARSTGAWSLVSCCVGPGFDFADFSLLRDLPQRDWPPGALAELI